MSVLREITQTGPPCGFMGSKAEKGKTFLIKHQSDGRFRFVIEEKSSGIVYGRAVEFRDLEGQALFIDIEWRIDGEFRSFASRTITEWTP